MSSKINVRGIATNVKWYPKEEKGAFHVLTFNVQEVDGAGNYLRLVPVTFKLTEYTNVVEDGQEVKVVGSMGRERILLAEKVINLKTNAEVSSYNTIAFAFAAMWLLWPASIVIGGLIGFFFDGSIVAIGLGLVCGFMAGIFSVLFVMVTTIGIYGLYSLIRGRG